MHQKIDDYRYYFAFCQLLILDWRSRSYTAFSLWRCWTHRSWINHSLRSCWWSRYYTALTPRSWQDWSCYWTPSRIVCRGGQ